MNDEQAEPTLRFKGVLAIFTRAGFAVLSVFMVLTLNQDKEPTWSWTWWLVQGAVIAWGFYAVYSANQCRRVVRMYLDVRALREESTESDA
jgi:hypothetical protein